MNRDRIHTIIQYALLVAGREDDFFDRELGPIHLIKYVYLADLHYATHNNGETYTGIEWKFHNFGPWSRTVNACIDTALTDISATLKRVESRYENCDDFKRWSVTNDSLLEKIEKKLPLVIWGQVSAMVHRFKKDTASLLDYVYNSIPMRNAAPEEVLDFSLVVKPEHKKIESKPKWDSLTERQRKKFRQAIKISREKIAKKKAAVKKGMVQSPLVVVHDKVYSDGVKWVDSLAGDPLPSGDHEAKFSDDIWYSETRKGDFPK